MIDPLVMSVPESAVSSLAEEAIGLGESAGVYLDDEQKLVLEHGLGVRDDNKWSAFEVGVCEPRQNGKNEILVVRQLAGMFLFSWEKLIIHSAHLFKTSTEHQRRIEEVVQSTPELHKRVKPRGYRHSHGEEGIELRDGTRINFVTRTATGGRGLTGDFVGLDEAMILAEATMGALMPTMSARSMKGNPQMWYQGSSVDQAIHDHGLVFSRVRSRGHARDAARLAWFEWAAAIPSASPGRPPLPQDLTEELSLDETLWAQANPALDRRISREFVLAELGAMDPRTFAVERLGIGDWPEPIDGAVIDLEAWGNQADAKAKMLDPVCLAFDVSPDRSSASIAAVGARRGKPRTHLGEVVKTGRGTGWVVPWIIERVPRHRPVAVICDAKGPAGSLVADLEKAGIDVRVVTAEEHSAACGMLYDHVAQKLMWHLGQKELTGALRGAKKRPLGDGGWGWGRRLSEVDITSLVSVTLALWGYLVLGGAYRHPTEPMIAYG